MMDMCVLSGIGWGPGRSARAPEKPTPILGCAIAVVKRKRSWCSAGVRNGKQPGSSPETVRNSSENRTGPGVAGPAKVDPRAGHEWGAPQELHPVGRAGAPGGACIARTT